MLHTSHPDKLNRSITLRTLPNSWVLVSVADRCRIPTTYAHLHPRVYGSFFLDEIDLHSMYISIAPSYTDVKAFISDTKVPHLLLTGTDMSVACSQDLHILHILMLTNFGGPLMVA